MYNIGNVYPALPRSKEQGASCVALKRGMQDKISHEVMQLCFDSISHLLQRI